MTDCDVLVVGAGPAGLGAAVAAKARGARVIVLERGPSVGGLAGGFSFAGGTLDLGPHFLESRFGDAAGVRDLLEEVPYVEDIQLRGRRCRFPLGLLREPRYVVSVGTGALRSLRPPSAEAPSLADHLRRAYGRAFAAEVLEPLIAKWSGRPCGELSADLAERFDPPSPRIVLHHAKVLLTRRSHHLSGDRVVWTRGKGGIGRVMEAIAARQRLDVRTGCEVTAIDLDTATITLAGGARLSARALVATQPWPVLARLCPDPRLAPFAALPHRAIVLLYLLIDRARVLGNQWTWFPAAEVPFYRASEPTNCGPVAGLPAGKAAIVLELATAADDATFCADDASLVEEGWRAFRALHELPAHALCQGAVLRARFGYPVYAREQRHLRRRLEAPVHPRLLVAGRFGLHRHIQSEASYETGRTAGDAASALPIAERASS